MALCRDKKRYDNRLRAENALAVARRQWERDRTRAPAPPIRVYQCDRCGGGWHLTHLPLPA